LSEIAHPASQGVIAEPALALDIGGAPRVAPEATLAAVEDILVATDGPVSAEAACTGLPRGRARARVGACPWARDRGRRGGPVAGKGGRRRRPGGAGALNNNVSAVVKDLRGRRARGVAGG